MSNTSSPHDFYLATINRSIDIDGVPKEQPYQCVDTFKAFTLWAHGFHWALGGTGGAKELWLQRSRYAQWFDFVTDINALKDGDFVVWDSSASNKWGHVAMFRLYQSGGLLCLGQNQPLPRHNQIVLGRANFLGALRPKKWIASPPVKPPEPPKPPVIPPAAFKVGDKVVPTRLVSYDGVPLVQWDNSYTITQLTGDRAVLSARGAIWAPMNVKDIKKV